MGIRLLKTHACLTLLAALGALVASGCTARSVRGGVKTPTVASLTAPSGGGTGVGVGGNVSPSCSISGQVLIGGSCSCPYGQILERNACVPACNSGMMPDVSGRCVCSRPNEIEIAYGQCVPVPVSGGAAAANCAVRGMVLDAVTGLCTASAPTPPTGQPTSRPVPTGNGCPAGQVFDVLNQVCVIPDTRPDQDQPTITCFNGSVVYDARECDSLAAAPSQPVPFENECRFTFSDANNADLPRTQTLTLGRLTTGGALTYEKVSSSETLLTAPPARGSNPALVRTGSQSFNLKILSGSKVACDFRVSLEDEENTMPAFDYYNPMVGPMTVSALRTPAAQRSQSVYVPPYILGQTPGSRCEWYQSNTAARYFDCKFGSQRNLSRVASYVNGRPALTYRASWTTGLRVSSSSSEKGRFSVQRFSECTGDCGQLGVPADANLNRTIIRLIVWNRESNAILPSTNPAGYTSEQLEYVGTDFLNVLSPIPVASPNATLNLR